MAYITVTIDDLKKQTNAEDDEAPVLKIYLKSATAYVKRLINRPLSDLTGSDSDILNMAVLMVATSWYLKRDGSASNASRSYSGLNSMIDTLRLPEIGG